MALGGLTWYVVSGSSIYGLVLRSSILALQFRFQYTHRVRFIDNPTQPDTGQIYVIYHSPLDTNWQTSPRHRHVTVAVYVYRKQSLYFHQLNIKDDTFIHMESTDKTLHDMQKKLDSMKKWRQNTSKQRVTDNNLTEEDKRQVFEIPTIYEHTKGSYQNLRAVSKTIKDTMDKEKIHLDVHAERSDRFDDVVKVLKNIEELSERASFDSLDLSQLYVNGMEPLLLKIIVEQRNSLKFLNFENCSINSQAIELAETMTKCSKLDHLNLSHLQHDRNDKVFSTLTPLLTKCTGLTDLDLSYNDQRGDSSISLADSLPKWKLLENLSLYCCGLNDDDIGFLTMSLPQCNFLAKLNLGNNKIGEVGALFIVTVLPNCLALHTLYLHDNYLKDSGAEKFEKMLDDGQKKEMKLVLSANEISSTTRQRICNKHQNVICIEI